MSNIDRASTIELIATYIAGILMGLLLALVWRAAQITQQYGADKKDAVEITKNHPGNTPGNK